ncbi:MAG: hypothetical protein ACI9VN_001941 [Patescibacteria group bacterium]
MSDLDYMLFQQRNFISRALRGNFPAVATFWDQPSKLAA